MSPSFRSITDDLVSAKRNSSRSPTAKHFRSQKCHENLSLTVDEYQSVEKTIQDSVPKRSWQTEVPSQSTTQVSNQHRKRSDDSDPEKFTRESKKARQQHYAKTPFRFSPDSFDSHQPLEEYSERPSQRNTPPIISKIFKGKVLPSHEELPNRKGQDRSEDSSTAMGHKQEHTTGGIRKGTNSNAVKTGRHSSRIGRIGLDPAGEQPEGRGKNTIQEAYTFPLRRLKCGISLPDDGDYVAELADNCLRLYDTKSPHGKGPALAPIQLSKILKVLHGSTDCLMLILRTSHCEGQPWSNTFLELGSRRDKEKFLSLMQEIVREESMLQKDEYAHLILFTLTLTKN